MNRILIIVAIFGFFLPSVGSRLHAQTDKEAFKDMVFSYICEMEIQHPHIVMQQAIIETGGFRAEKLMAKNNLFGFKRQGKVIIFNHWKQSVEFYKEWQDKRYTNPEEDYYAFLKRIRYATNPKYRQHLRGTGFTKSCLEVAPEKHDEFSLEENRDSTIYEVVPELEKVLSDKENIVVYQVKKGDTLSHIAVRHKTTVSEIKKLNGMTSTRIKPGQKLKVKMNTKK